MPAWIRTSMVASLLVVGLAAVGCGGDEEPPQGAVEGTVTLEGADQATGVEVTLPGAGESTETASDGAFRFEELSPGRLEVRLERRDYVPATREVEVVDGGTATLEVTLEQINEPPRIAGVTVDPSKLEPGATADIEVTATDPNPDEVTYTYEVSGDFAIDSTDGATAVLAAPDAFDTQDILNVRVEDGDGLVDTTQVPVATIDNRPPLITGMSASPSTLEPAGTATLTAGASDPEGDELTYEWTAPEGWTLASDDSASVEVTAPDEYSATGVFELQVTDERDRSTTATLPLTTVANQGPRITSIGATPRPVERAGTVELHVSAGDPNGDDVTYEWTAPGDWTLSDASAAEPTLTAPDAAGQSANIDLTVTDTQGLEATASVRVSTVPNNRPVISDVSAESTTLNPEGTTEVSASADDPNGDALSYSWSVANGDWSYSGSGDAITLTAPNKTASATKVTVTVSDDAGGESTGSTVVTTGPNERPDISSLYATNNPVARGGSTDVTVLADDPNGDDLTYSWSLDNTDWSQSGSGDTVTLDAPDTPTSSVLVTVEVEDTQGAVRSASTQVSTVSNKAPQITTIPSSTSTAAGRGSEYVYEARATDPDDSNLTWSVSTDPPSTATASDGTLSWQPKRTARNTDHTVNLSVSDGTDTVTQTFTVSVRGFSMQLTDTFDVGNPYSDTSGRVGAIGDFDGDGLDDMAAETRLDDSLAYALSSRDYWEDEISWPQGQSSFDTCQFNGAGDLDGDGDLDVVTACDEDGSGNADLRLATWFNDIDQSTQQGEFSTGEVTSSGEAVAVADLVVGNIDGNTGVEAIVADADGTLRVAGNDGSGSLTLGQTVSPGQPAAAASGYEIRKLLLDDFDGDSDDELLALEGYENGTGQTRAQLAIYSIDASGSLQSTRQTTTALDGNPSSVTAGDLDDDGDLDVAVKTTTDPTKVASYLNDGSGSFTKQDTLSDKDFEADADNFAATMAQVDDDGDLDVVISADFLSTYAVFGDGSGNLTATDSVAGGASALFTGTYNADGHDDLYVWDYGEFTIRY